MAGELPDAKIVVQLDTEGALKALRDLESRIREADLQFQRFGREGAGAGAPGAAPGQAAPPRAAAAIPVDDEEKKKKRRGGLLAGKPKVPNIGRMIAEKEMEIVKIGVSAIPWGGPPAAKILDFIGKRAIPLLQFGPAFADAGLEKIKKTTREGVPEILEPAVNLAFRKIEAMMNAMSIHMSDLDAKQKGLEGALGSFNQLLSSQWGAGLLDSEMGVFRGTEFAKQFMAASWDLEEMRRKKELTMRRFLYKNLGDAAPKALRTFTGGSSP